jgi:tetratricopeptide (TPR) repeat protein
MNRISEAIPLLKRSTELEPESAPYWLALGIALQLMEDFEGAVEALRAAIKIDPNYVTAINSLALTRKKMGELDKALDDYDTGVTVLAQTIVKDFNNSRTSPIFKHVDTRGQLWLGYAFSAALRLAAPEDIKGIAWPTGEQAMKEERTEEHGGLYWVSLKNKADEDTRLYLPNYFNTFREALRGNSLYTNLIGNRGTVLEMLGRQREAEEHFSEAEEFSRRN